MLHIFTVSRCIYWLSLWQSSYLFFYNLIYYWFIMYFYIIYFNPTHLPIPSHLPSTPATSLHPEEDRIKFIRKEREKRKPLYWGYSVIQWVTEHFSPHILFASVRYNESLVCFEASSFCYPVDAEPSQKSSWLSCCFSVSWRSCNIGSAGPADSCAQDHLFYASLKFKAFNTSTRHH